MITDSPRLTALLDDDVVGFLTHVNEEGQPQTSPVWFLRVEDEIVVYNKPGTPRLDAIDANPKVAFNLRGDRRADAVVTLEGEARRADLPPATELPGYIAKYAQDIERLGWTPDSFASDYRDALSITVTRVRAWGLGKGTN